MVQVSFNRVRASCVLRFGLYLRLYRYERAVVPSLTEYHYAIDQCEECMVFTDTYIFSGMVYCAALPHEDVTCFGHFTTEYLNAQSFTFRFAAVLRTTNTFFMCHFLLILTD